MSIPSACCKLAPVQSGYTPQGTTFNLEDNFTVYETKDKSPKRILICAYDIFGYHNVTKQVADRLADSGFRVVMPDFFRGEPLDVTKIPLSDRPALLAWIAEKGTWDKTVKEDLLKVLKHYKEKEGVTAFGIYGFCWGARVAIDAVTEIPDIQAAGLIHPSLWKTEDAEKIKKPVIGIPTKDDDDMTAFFEILKKNVGEDNCLHQRFEDCHHGFCAARGDLTNDLNRQRVDEALDLLHKFFNKHVKE